MELTTYLGRRPDKLEIDYETGQLKTKMTPLVKLEVPIMFAAMSYGAVSLNVQESLARAAAEMGTMWNTGEGGLHPSLYKYGNNTIVQVASGRFGVHAEYLDAGRIVEIKIGQGAKPGIGGHLPGEKVSAEVSLTRMIPRGDGRPLAGAAARHLLHRGPGPAHLRPQGGDQLHQADIGQDSRSA